MVAYLVLTYNETLQEVRPEGERIDTVVNTIDYRGNPAFAPVGMFGNAAITITSPPFTLPTFHGLRPRIPQRHFDESLAVIALSIREGSRRLRDVSFLGLYLQFHNDLCQKCYKNNLFQDISPATPREITFNSAYSLDFRGTADFYGDDSGRCRRVRFHTTALMENYIRIFPANPWVTDEGEWDWTFDGGAEASFLLDEGLILPFRMKVERDLENDFQSSATSNM